ncbi:protein of unknown function DUF29 [Ancylobacter novellus DSM 506]|uniref:DUF29 domain-containing protein n=1 Tax=Ancylobacter novellus (strain ATCC 8093 / DSM 506 / JCM 20403 / CCM 1077 / IAM 12100 / NBRC 12443 / NCIMB 10456) TaxID=639283 RepID=D7A7U1_ANCN5|nr:DUF29 domain-containing protein [Ancylobacter novellus]ADH90399.1 protein of unknown function DUF29 [Ancylobacter novellus DSM 506]
MSTHVTRTRTGDTAPATDYDTDFHAWAMEQAKRIREGAFEALDRENVAEEIESLGREQFSKLRSAYRVLLMHMLKWDHQPEKRTRSWLLTIVQQRQKVEDVITDSPSLKSRREEATASAYRGARKEAAAETGIPLRTFPETNPYPLDEIMERAFDL